MARRTITTRRTPPLSEQVRIDLTDLLYAYEETLGTGKLVVMAQLRHYVNTRNVLDTIDEIKRITDPKWLDVLIGVGMPGVLWSAVVAQKAKLMGVD